MATSKQSSLYRNLTYSNEIKDQIVRSGGTIVFMRDNIIMASEISEAQYVELSNSPYIDKVDILSLKRYGDEGVKYEKVDSFEENNIIEEDNTNFTDI